MAGNKNTSLAGKIRCQNLNFLKTIHWRFSKQTASGKKIPHAAVLREPPV
jgi:hypothetical protein